MTRLQKVLALCGSFAWAAVAGAVVEHAISARDSYFALLLMVVLTALYTWTLVPFVSAELGRERRDRERHEEADQTGRIYSGAHPVPASHRRRRAERPRQWEEPWGPAPIPAQPPALGQERLYDYNGLNNSGTSAALREGTGDYPEAYGATT